MKLVLPRALLLVALGINPSVDGFTIQTTTSPSSTFFSSAPRVTTFQRTNNNELSLSTTALYAKKKKGIVLCGPYDCFLNGQQKLTGITACNKWILETLFDWDLVEIRWDASNEEIKRKLQDWLWIFRDR